MVEVFVKNQHEKREKWSSPRKNLEYDPSFWTVTLLSCGNKTMRAASEDIRHAVSSECLFDMIRKANDDLDDEIDMLLYPDPVDAKYSEKYDASGNAQSDSYEFSPDYAADPIVQSNNSAKRCNTFDVSALPVNAAGPTQRFQLLVIAYLSSGCVTAVTTMAVYCLWTTAVTLFHMMTVTLRDWTYLVKPGAFAMLLFTLNNHLSLRVTCPKFCRQC